MKRVLIIGYFFLDPSMGGVRLRRIARFLPQHGWEPIILSHPRNPASPAEPPTGARVEEVGGVDLPGLYRRWRGLLSRKSAPEASGKKEPKVVEISFTSKVNRWFVIPDKQAPWYGSALRRAREVIRREKIDAIFASLEPRTCALVASKLSRETGIPCILEYRDLWTGSPYYHIAQPTALHRRLHERLERNALRQARRVSAVCRGIADYLSEKYAGVLQAPVEVNYNFFDPGECPAPVARQHGEGPFIVSYTGAMYADRSPHRFFEGMRSFLDREQLTPAQFRFRWAGSVIGVAGLDEVLDKTRARPYVDFLGQIRHQEALRELAESDAALLVQAPGDAIHIPGKLFEAMGAHVPLLAVAHPCEVVEIINRCHAGLVCPHTPESVTAALGEFYRRSLRRERWNFNEPELQRFSAKQAVGKLAALFERAL